MRPIVLLTDFGLQDSYVGQAKGAILSIHKRAQIVDLTHDISPYCIEAAAYILARSYAVFPKGCVFVCVVDPGVGTHRRGIAVKVDGQFFVGPDNGLLSIVIRENAGAEIRELRNKKFWRREVSSTFHGRDLFCPVGAHLARKPGNFKLLGPLLKNIKMLPHSSPIAKGKYLVGRIMLIDRFGNLITNLPYDSIAPHSRVYFRRYSIPKISPTYGAAKSSGLVSVPNSLGLIEIAVREGSCAKRTRAKIGEKVWVERKR